MQTPSVTIGSTLSHFRITAQLGAGGMGEVYRAEDSALGRDVAIKVLSAAFTADPDRLARFEREARTLASLSHPNIAAIHEVGRENGTLFLVMELARGETLAERLARGPLAVGEALPIAVQIAEALEAAHEQGIVHRDLKPANVMVDEEARVKVLDFGLAKALGSDGEASTRGLTNSPTLSLQATRAGVLLGTAAYMSPEQAAGRAADRRADVWAFGAVLFEMLTARPAFGGETLSHVLASVLKDEPSWDTLPSGLSPRLRHLLERCLRKDPRDRLQAIGDARLVAEEVLARPELDLAPVVVGAPRAPWRTWLPWAVAAGATLGLLALAGARLAAPERDELRLEVALPKGTALGLDHQTDLIAISRDGRRQVVLIRDADGARRLVLRELGELYARSLQGTEEASSPFFSPDGEQVAFFARGKLWRTSVTGGPPSPVVDVPAGDQNRGGTWAEDGYIYAAPDTILPLQRVPENGGAFEDVTTLDPARRERTHRWPEALPGGAVVFTCDTLESTESYDDARIEVLLPGTGERKVLVEQSSRARYLASGHLVFARGGALFAVSFDRETLEVHGKPVVVLQGVATTVASGAAHFALSPTGTLAYVPGEMSEGVRPPFWIDRASGAQEPSTIEVAPTALELSPDGRRAALLLSEAGSLDLWVADLERGTANRLTFTGNAQSPVWSRDGRWVAFTDRDGVYRQSTESAGAPELLLRVDPSVVDRTYPTSFTLDGEALMVEYPPGPDQQADLGLVQIGSDPTRPPTPVVATPNRDAMGVVSPDGRWLAYISVESGRASLYVRSLEPGGSPWLISRPAWEPRWSADGREVYYRAGLGDLWVTTMEGGTPQRITSGLRTGDGAHQYGVAPDGLRFLSLGLNEFHEVDRIHLLLDWDREVRRLGSRNR